MNEWMNGDTLPTIARDGSLALDVPLFWNIMFHVLGTKFLAKVSPGLKDSEKLSRAPVCSLYPFYVLPFFWVKQCFVEETFGFAPADILVACFQEWLMYSILLPLLSLLVYGE